jgi:tetratricopeptide (TPR) repeat protein
MKLIGSVTKHFPFLEKGDREIIVSLVEQSKNYTDFVDRLLNHVMTVESSDIMVFLAWHHLWGARYFFNAREKFLERFSQQVWLRPEYTGWKMDTPDEDTLLEVVEDALTTSTNPLILLHLYWFKMVCIRGSSTGTLTEDETIKNLADLIRTNPLLEFARSKLYLLMGDGYQNEGKPQEAMKEYDSALQHALMYDDIVFTTSVLTRKAKILALTDPTKALEFIESAANQAKKLGFLERSVGIFTVMGAIFDARGEYDAAVKSFQEALELREKQNPLASLRLTPSALSRSYRRMGKYEEALEWAKTSLTTKSLESSHIPSIGVQVLSNLCMSAALAMLGRIDEAKSYHDVGNELALKAGIEVWLSDVLLSEGLISRAEGRLSDALESFENALEVMEKLHRQGRINECLYLLAETEIQLQYDEGQRVESLLALHWINELEEMAQRKNLPGILGLALLLKARIQLLNRKEEAARVILHQVSELSENPSMMFLKDRIAMVSPTYTPKGERKWRS